jgi:hypothetical protein
MDVDAELKRRKEARMARVKEIKDMTAVERVRVVPTDEKYRTVLRHPTTNQPFPKSGSQEWPLDQFTKRRIREGALAIDSGEGAGGEEGHRDSSGPKDKSQPAKTSKSKEPLASQEPQQTGQTKVY